MADAQEITVGEQAVRISNPDKVYFAERGITKLDVVRYSYWWATGFSGRRDRPTTMERWPSGVKPGVKLATRGDRRGDAFFQKRVPKGAPEWVETAQIAFPSGRTADEVCPTELAVVAWAVNLGTLTFHPWPVRAIDTDMPDELRIDLDPQPGTDFADAVTVAGVAREVLDELGWEGIRRPPAAVACTSMCGSRRAGRLSEARRAVIAFAREIGRRRPDLATTSWWKEERGERVFIDYNQMARDRTIACAYSFRPTPVRWCRRHWTGRSWTRLPRKISMSPRCRSDSPGLAICTPALPGRRSPCYRCSSWPTGSNATRGSEICRIRRTIRRWRANRSESNHPEKPVPPRKSTRASLAERLKRIPGRGCVLRWL